MLLFILIVINNGRLLGPATDFFRIAHLKTILTTYYSPSREKSLNYCALDGTRYLLVVCAIILSFFFLFVWHLSRLYANTCLFIHLYTLVVISTHLNHQLNVMRSFHWSAFRDIVVFVFIFYFFIIFVSKHKLCLRVLSYTSYFLSTSVLSYGYQFELVFYLFQY